MDDGWGFVYIVKIKTRDDVYKIGATINIKKRMSTLKTRLVYGFENPLELIDICFTQDRYLKECDMEQYPEGLCGDMGGDCMNCSLPANMRRECLLAQDEEKERLKCH